MAKNSGQNVGGHSDEEDISDDDDDDEGQEDGVDDDTSSFIESDGSPTNDGEQSLSPEPFSQGLAETTIVEEDDEHNQLSDNEDGEYADGVNHVGASWQEDPVTKANELVQSFEESERAASSMAWDNEIEHEQGDATEVDDVEPSPRLMDHDGFGSKERHEESESSNIQEHNNTQPLDIGGETVLQKQNVGISAQGENDSSITIDDGEEAKKKKKKKKKKKTAESSLAEGKGPSKHDGVSKGKGRTNSTTTKKKRKSEGGTTNSKSDNEKIKDEAKPQRKSSRKHSNDAVATVEVHRRKSGKGFFKIKRIKFFSKKTKGKSQRIEAASAGAGESKAISRDISAAHVTKSDSETVTAANKVVLGVGSSERQTATSAVSKHTSSSTDLSSENNMYKQDDELVIHLNNKASKAGDSPLRIQGERETDSVEPQQHSQCRESSDSTLEQYTNTVAGTAGSGIVPLKEKIGRNEDGHLQSAFRGSDRTGMEVKPDTELESTPPTDWSRALLDISLNINIHAAEDDDMPCSSDARQNTLRKFSTLGRASHNQRPVVGSFLSRERESVQRTSESYSVSSSLQSSRSIKWSKWIATGIGSQAVGGNNSTSSFGRSKLKSNSDPADEPNSSLPNNKRQLVDSSSNLKSSEQRYHQKNRPGLSHFSVYRFYMEGSMQTRWRRQSGARAAVYEDQAGRNSSKSSILRGKSSENVSCEPFSNQEDVGGGSTGNQNESATMLGKGWEQSGTMTNQSLRKDDKTSNERGSGEVMDCPAMQINDDDTTEEELELYRKKMIDILEGYDVLSRMQQNSTSQSKQNGPGKEMAGNRSHRSFKSFASERSPELEEEQEGLLQSAEPERSVEDKKRLEAELIEMKNKVEEESLVTTAETPRMNHTDEFKMKDLGEHVRPVESKDVDDSFVRSTPSSKEGSFSDSVALVKDRSYTNKLDGSRESCEADSRECDSSFKSPSELYLPFPPSKSIAEQDKKYASSDSQSTPSPISSSLRKSTRQSGAILEEMIRRESCASSAAVSSDESYDAAFRGLQQYVAGQHSNSTQDQDRIRRDDATSNFSGDEEQVEYVRRSCRNSQDEEQVEYARKSYRDNLNHEQVEDVRKGYIHDSDQERVKIGRETCREGLESRVDIRVTPMLPPTSVKWGYGSLRRRKHQCSFNSSEDSLTSDPAVELSRKANEHYADDSHRAPPSGEGDFLSSHSGAEGPTLERNLDPDIHMHRRSLSIRLATVRQTPSSEPHTKRRIFEQYFAREEEKEEEERVTQTCRGKHGRRASEFGTKIENKVTTGSPEAFKLRSGLGRAEMRSGSVRASSKHGRCSSMPSGVSDETRFINHEYLSSKQPRAPAGTETSLSEAVRQLLTCTQPWWRVKREQEKDAVRAVQEEAERIVNECIKELHDKVAEQTRRDSFARQCVFNSIAPDLTAIHLDRTTSTWLKTRIGRYRKHVLKKLVDLVEMSKGNGRFAGKKQTATAQVDADDSWRTDHYISSNCYTKNGDAVLWVKSLCDLFGVKYKISEDELSAYRTAQSERRSRREGRFPGECHILQTGGMRVRRHDNKHGDKRRNHCSDKLGTAETDSDAQLCQRVEEWECMTTADMEWEVPEYLKPLTRWILPMFSFALMSKFIDEQKESFSVLERLEIIRLRSSAAGLHKPTIFCPFSLSSAWNSSVSNYLILQRDHMPRGAVDDYVKRGYAALEDIILAKQRSQEEHARTSPPNRSLAMLPQRLLYSLVRKSASTSPTFANLLRAVGAPAYQDLSFNDEFCLNGVEEDDGDTGLGEEAHVDDGSQNKGMAKLGATLLLGIETFHQQTNGNEAIVERLESP